MIPYNYRPHNIWYNIKCFLWHRYSTIKPRYLGHTWCDVTDLLPHMVFELLSKFIEGEADQIEWYGEYPHMVDDKNVRDIMQDLYDWWHNQLHEAVADILYKEMKKHTPISVFNDEDWFDPKYKTPEDKVIYKRLSNALNKLEVLYDNDLEIRMIQLVKIRRYLWS